MHGLIRNAIGITLGATALALNACTISDASDKKQPATVGAATAQAATTPPPATPASAAATAPGDTGASAAMAMAPGATTDSARAATSSSPPGTTSGTANGTVSSAAPSAPPGASGSTASAPGTATASSSPSSGALSPDSVDVGKRSKADSIPIAPTRLEVDLAARKLYVYENDSRTATYPVAVGSPEWPTQTGQWFVKQVIWNPEWIPPDETWAEQKVPRKPGAPDNPLGRAQLVYDPPRTIHGTNEPASIGKPVSHGSIRLANAVIVKLARQIMDETGAQKDDAWYARVQANRTQKVVVNLPKRVPIKVF